MRYSDSHIDLFLKKNPYKHFLKLKKNLSAATFANYLEFENDFNLEDYLNVQKRIISQADDTKVSFMIEDSSFVKLTEIEAILAYRPQIFSLSWNYDNRLCGGSFGCDTLSQEGANYIKTIEKLGGQLDLSHLNKSSFFDAIKITRKPLLATHSAISNFGHLRNLTYEQGKIIVENDGFVGFPLVQSFYSEKTNVSSLKIAEAVDAAVQKFGIDYFGFGSDFFGTNDLPYDIFDYSGFSKFKLAFESFGYSKIDIEKLLSNNYICFLKKASIIK